MNNFELHEKAQELADTKTAYSLARELVELRERMDVVKKEAFSSGYWYASEGSYPDMTYQENVFHAYGEWLFANKLEKGEL